MIEPKTEITPENFTVGAQGPDPEAIELSRTQIIPGMGNVALLGLSEYNGELDIESRVEKPKSVNEDGVSLVNAVCRAVRVHRDPPTGRLLPNRHQPTPSERYVTGKYHGPGSPLTLSKEPLDKSELDLVLTTA